MDDQSIRCLNVTPAMAAFGFATGDVTALEAAIERIERHQYDVIVLDPALGERKAISLARLIAAGPADPIVIVISRQVCYCSGPGRLAETGGTDGTACPAGAIAVTRPRLPDIYSTGAISEELGETIDQHRIVAAFQPKIDVDSGAVVGVEPPAPLAPYAARQYPAWVARPLTQSILGDALARCRRWRSHHPICSAAVNLSPLALAYLALPDQIEALLLQYGLAPGALIAEITETTVIVTPLLAAKC